MMFATVKNETEKKTANHTGIPNTMKKHFEKNSGYCLNDVRVHYHSDKPAQLQALAYTQGNRIYIAPGQEKHLAHELGHVIQQKKGIVRPTATINGMAVNQEKSLEKDADSWANKKSIAPYTNTAQMKKEVIQKQEEYNTVTPVTMPNVFSREKRLIGMFRWYQRLGQYQFVSKDNGKIGSLYFQRGRIRLLHAHGPEITIHQNLQRYVINPEIDANAVLHTIGANHPNRAYRRYIANTVTNLNTAIGQPQANWKLFETFTMAPGHLGTHPSRGMPENCPFLRWDLRRIYNAVEAAPRQAPNIANLSQEKRENLYVARQLTSLHQKLGWNAAYINGYTT